ncbi:MAG: SLATT domain-containing protein, partial [Chloroflexota bacterium]
MMEGQYHNVMPNPTTDPNTYMEHRWTTEHRRYLRAAQTYQRLNIGVTLVALGATLAAFTVGASNPPLQMSFFGMALGALALVVLYDFREQSRRSRRVATALQRERGLLEAGVGPYADAATAQTTFVRSCEMILAAEGDAYASLMIAGLAERPEPKAEPKPTTPPESPFSGRSSRAASTSSSRSPFSSSRFGSRPSREDDEEGDPDTEKDEEGTSSKRSNPFSGRTRGNPFESTTKTDSPFGGRSSSSKSPFSRSSSSPFSSRSSSSSSSRFSGGRPIGSSGGMRREGNDDPALAGVEQGNSRTGVRFAAYYPKEIAPGVWQPLKAYAMLGYAQDAVAADAEGRSTEKLPEILFDRNRNGRYRIPEGAQVTAQPYMPGIQFNPAVVTLGFYRNWHRFDFELRATDTAALDESTNGYITFMVDGLIVADVPLSLYVGRGAGKDPRNMIRRVFRKPYRSVYASFADEDREVAARFQRVYDALGMYTLRDVMEMRADGEWHADLLDFVDKADVFQLMWSTAAAEADSVSQEVARAVGRDDAPANF